MLSSIKKINSFLDSDPRILQILLMGSLLSIGVFVRDFSILNSQILLTFSSAILTHFIWCKILKSKIPYFSTLITCLGLSLLLRSDTIWMHPLIAFIAISSKFIIRFKEKHIFNPAMFGVVLAAYVFKNSWVSPGQWGFELSISFWLLLFGLIIIGRAKISEISYAFLFFYSLFLLYRIFIYGYKLEVFFHQFQNGAFILFSFFMITDPKTIPNHRITRVLHAFLVALVAYQISFSFFKPNGLILSLFFCSPIVIIWDFIFKSKVYKWSRVSEKNVLPN